MATQHGKTRVYEGGAELDTSGTIKKVVSSSSATGGDDSKGDDSPAVSVDPVMDARKTREYDGGLVLEVSATPNVSVPPAKPKAEDVPKEASIPDPQLDGKKLREYEGGPVVDTSIAPHKDVPRPAAGASTAGAAGDEAKIPDPELESRKGRVYDGGATIETSNAVISPTGAATKPKKAGSAAPSAPLSPPRGDERPRRKSSSDYTGGWTEDTTDGV